MGCVSTRRGHVSPWSELSPDGTTEPLTPACDEVCQADTAVPGRGHGVVCQFSMLGDGGNQTWKNLSGTRCAYLM
jgi:hypothetical protein